MNNRDKRIAKNTILLYIRMIFVMLVNLIIVRFVLKALGDEDYGIFNVVAGVITMFSCVSSVLATATQRFYSIAMGENDNIKLSSIFSCSLNIFLVLSAIIVLISETFGLWFVNTYLVIPEGRMFAANCVYHLTILGFVWSILLIPYYTSIIAHEDMNYYAIISIVECILKLVFAILIPFVNIDHLIVYSISSFIVQTLVLLSYYIIGHSKYSECHYSFSFSKDKSLYKQLLSFSGWTLFGSVANIGMMQVVTILINVFFGPIISAARAISLQIYIALNSFVNSFVLAIRPPMVKSYAESNYTYLNVLFNISNKFILYCFLAIAIPLFVEMPTVLKLWLGAISNETIIFSRLMVVYMVILSMQNPITIIMQAAGKVKQYFVPVETCTLLCVPITFILYKIGNASTSSYYTMIIIVIVSHLIRLNCLSKNYPFFELKQYITSLIIPGALVSAICITVSLILHNELEHDILRLLSVIVVNLIVLVASVFVVGLKKSERKSLYEYIKSKIA